MIEWNFDLSQDKTLKLAGRPAVKRNEGVLLNQDAKRSRLATARCGSRDHPQHRPSFCTGIFVLGRAVVPLPGKVVDARPRIDPDLLIAPASKPRVFRMVWCLARRRVHGGY